jgi:hypothetical protein
LFEQTIRIKPGVQTVLFSIVSELQHFERKYGYTTEESILRFESGMLPKSEDFFTWRIAHLGYQNVSRRFGLSR